MSQVQTELRNWTVGALNIIRLIGKAANFATLCWKFKTNEMYENLKNFKTLKEKENQNPALYSTQWPPDNWAGVLDHLAIGLVDIKYTKHGKISEKLLLILGLAHINFPLC